MRRKLLLADDSITVQRVIELTFADEDLDVITAGDGGQAVALIERERPEIVFADLTMPVRDGYGVAEHVKRTPALVVHTRVVLLTGAFEPVDQERAELLGIDGVLAKPFEPRVAIELVRELLDKPPLPPKPRDERSAAAGYPFEPGAGARATPAELDDYFQRLDEALASAGLVASSAVRDMLAESKGGRAGAGVGAGQTARGERTEPRNDAPRDNDRKDSKDAKAGQAGNADTNGEADRNGTDGKDRKDDGRNEQDEERGTARTAGAGAHTAASGTGGAAPGAVGALTGPAEAVREKKTQMSAASSGVSAGHPGGAAASGTLVDAFSALLAEEQGETLSSSGGAAADAGSGSGSGASLDASSPASASAFTSALDSDSASDATSTASPGSGASPAARSASAAGGNTDTSADVATASASASASASISTAAAASGLGAESSAASRSGASAGGPSGLASAAESAGESAAGESAGGGAAAAIVAGSSASLTSVTGTTGGAGFERVSAAGLSAVPALTPVSAAAAALGAGSGSDAGPGDGALPAASVTALSQAAAAFPVTDQLLDAIARRIVDQYGERILREIVSARVVDIAERLVREEIERLKAAADRA